MCMALIIMFAGSCNKIEHNTVPTGWNGRTVINGVAESIGSGTKADMACCYEFIWRKYDQIYVTDGAKYNDLCISDITFYS